MPKLSVLVTVDSALVEELLNGVSLHQLALGEAITFSKANNGEVIEVNRSELLERIKTLDSQSDSDVIVIHDALRPLVSAAQFQRTFDALGDLDAIRPTMAFTETIKSLDSEHRLNETIDREKVRRISSPEVIKRGAIDFGGRATTWSVPLKAGSKFGEVQADAESIRINCTEELQLISAFLQLRK